MSGALKEESEENIEKIIVNKFKKCWLDKKSVIDKYEDSKIINFVKKMKNITVKWKYTKKRSCVKV